MTIETVAHITDLNATYPAAGDPKSEGDDHIRNIKTALLADLPDTENAAGIVYSTNFGAGNTHLRKIHQHLVVARLRFAGTGAGTPIVGIATLPVGYRPAVQLIVPGFVSPVATNLPKMATFIIDPSGLIRIQAMYDGISASPSSALNDIYDLLTFPIPLA